MRDDFSPFLPLSPATLHILLSLAGGELHGYGIMQEVSRHSDGKYKLGPGTLYDNLQKLMDQAIVEEAPAKRRDTDSRRRYYRLTRLGRSVLAAEVERLEGVLHEARMRLETAKPGRVS
jgi:DNA-binding PadR family transcriptional regulator